MRNVRKDNGLEVWRLLHRRYCPRTTAARSAKLRLVTTFGERHANSPIGKVTDLIQQFEKLNEDYNEEFRVYAVSTEIAKDTLRQLIPDAVERAISLAYIGQNQDAMSYETLKMAIEEHIQHSVPMPMDVGSVTPQGQSPNPPPSGSRGARPS